MKGKMLVQKVTSDLRGRTKDGREIPKFGSFERAGVELHRHTELCATWDAMHNMLTAAELRIFGWQSYVKAPIFVRLLQSFRPYICPLEKVLENVPEGSGVLDIGCGTGGLLFQAARYRQLREGHGLDSASSSIDVARRVAETIPTKIKFESAQSFDQWPCEQFDVVTTIDVLHHVPPEMQDEFLKQALARVKPRGLFIYKDMAQKPAFCAISNRIHDLILARQWIHYYPFERAIEIVRDQAFTVDKTWTGRRLVYQHEMLVAFASY